MNDPTVTVAQASMSTRARGVLGDLRATLRDMVRRALYAAAYALREKDSGIFAHAEVELAATGAGDDYDGMIGDAVRELLALFVEQRHSGGSAGQVAVIFSKLALFRPLGPLTGEPSEWREVADGVWQNVRCGQVFHEGAGAYDIFGRVFVEPSGCQFTSKASRVPVTFPYTPTAVYVNVDENGDEI